MTIQELTTQSLCKILGLSNDSVSDLLFKKSDDGSLSDEINEDALSKIEELAAKHILQSSSETLDAKYNDGHKAGKFEALSKLEDELRKQYGVEGKNIKDVISAIVTKSAADASSEDNVKTHPLYLGLMAEKEAAVSSVKTEWENKFNEFKTQAEKKDRFTSQIPTIEALLSEAGAVMPKSPQAQATLKKIFFDHFSDFDFEVKDTGTFLKGSDGALLKDKLQHPITLQDYVKMQIPNYFDVAVQPSRESPGNEGGQGGPPQTKFNGQIPKTPEEFQRQYFTLPESERTAFAQAFEAQNRQVVQ